jgi:hypothetical protein
MRNGGRLRDAAAEARNGSAMFRPFVAALALAALFTSPVRGAVADDMDGMHNDAPMPHMALSAQRPVMMRYTTVAAAERDGYAKFLPTLKLPMEHFTNSAIAAQAARGHFDAAKPTAIIYERSGEKLTLVGVMYTANAHASEDTLDAAIPLSVARWHRHVDFCFKAGDEAALGGDPRFGMGGAIDTKAACDAAGGSWRPQLFGWMVHVWPLETDPKKQWSVEDPNGHGAMTDGMRM